MTVLPAPPRPGAPPAEPLAPRPGADGADLRWAVVTVLLGPVADRQPDLALSLLACADDVVAAARVRWRRHGAWPARP